jgi:PKD repeat protein
MSTVHRFPSRVICAFTMVLIAATAGPSLDALAGSPAAATGSLAISTDPTGAAVYVDGQYAGQTPVALATVVEGSHRVRVVKSGFLENARLVKIVAGQSQTVQVRLTPDLNAGAAPQVTGGDSGGGLLKNKWFWIAAAGAGAGAAAGYVATRNTVPDAGTVGFSPTATGMANITSFSFTSTAADPDGDALSYAWDFGDGGSGTGASPSHVFSSPGTYQVVLTVNDGNASASTPAATVTVARNMSGSWSSVPVPGLSGATAALSSVSQSGGSLGGTFTFGGSLTGSVGGLVGSASPLTHPSSITIATGPFTISPFAGTFVLRFTGTTAASGNSMTGTITLTQSTGTTNSINPVTFSR